MGFSCLILTVIPLRLVAKMIPLHIGFEFFVLQALRSHYPRHRSLFNALNLLLWDVPNDAEYALEVVRLSHNTTQPADIDPSPSTSTASASSEGLRHRELHQDTSSLSAKSFSSMSDISDTLFTSVAERASRPPQENATLQDTITANVKTLALLATASAVSRVKNAVDNKGVDTNQKSTLEDETNGNFLILKFTSLTSRSLWMHVSRDNTWSYLIT